MSRLALLSLSIIASTMGSWGFPSTAEAGKAQQARPVMIVDCSSDTATSQALCLAVRDQLETIATPYLVRLGQPLANMAPNHIAIEIVTSHSPAGSLEGQLNWHKGAAEQTAGPVIRPPGTVAKPTKNALKDFAHEILQASDLPVRFKPPSQ